MNKIWALFATFLTVPAAMACAVCNGAPDDPQTKAAKVAIIFMITVTYLVVGWILVKFIRLIRRQS